MTIVIVAYNRYHELKRLLDSLLRADYQNDQVNLIISIDYGDNENIINLCEEYEWAHGEKILLKRESNLGLRKHILKCGDLSLEVGPIIMLEDDLLVSENFYVFAKQAVEYYKDDNRIAGISLYTYRLSEFAELRPFIPMQDESDVFFMKVPSSWGQIWTGEQWLNFRKWYDDNKDKASLYQGNIPDKVMAWRESSWKKYFAIYLSVTNKYFVYPRVALSTNMGAKGTHNVITSNTHQAILMGNVFQRRYIFRDLDKSNCRYDSFMENEIINFKDKNIHVDYYGLKQKYIKSGLLLSTEKLKHKIIKQWGLDLVPYELNIIYNIEGDDIYLYEISENEKSAYNYSIFKRAKLLKYEIPSLSREKGLIFALVDYKEAIKRKIKKYM